MTGIFSLAATLIAGERKNREVAPVISFETVYEAHFAFAWRSLRGLGVAPDAIDDAAQEVFIIVHRKLDTVTDPAGIRSWIFSIVRRVASDHRRSKIRKGVSVEYNDTATASENETPHRAVESRQMLALVEHFLNDLSDENRSIFVLSEIEQLPISQIAPLVEMNTNTIYSRLKVIKQDLEKFMARQETVLKAGRK